MFPDTGVVSIGGVTVDFGSRSPEPAGRLPGTKRHGVPVAQSFSTRPCCRMSSKARSFVQKRRQKRCGRRPQSSSAGLGCPTSRMRIPYQLSGGQQQRVGIARALALRPKLVLFDEPTQRWTPELVGEVLSVIRDLATEGWTLVIVTHEIQFARQVSDQVLFIDQGVVLEQGSPTRSSGTRLTIGRGSS